MIFRCREEVVVVSHHDGPVHPPLEHLPLTPPLSAGGPHRDQETLGRHAGQRGSGQVQRAQVSADGL